MNKHPPFKSHRLPVYVITGIVSIVAFVVTNIVAVVANHTPTSMLDLGPVVITSLMSVVLMALYWEVFLFVERVFRGFKRVVHDLIWMVIF